MVESHAIIDLRPYGMAPSGEATAQNTDGRLTFIAGALPNELVRAAVIQQHARYDRAITIEVLEPSAHRTPVACPEIARGCGGCQWQHVTLQGQRGLKEVMLREALEATSASTPTINTIVELPAVGYRTTVRAAVVGGNAGYRRLRSHHILNVAACLVAHPLIEDLLGCDFGLAEEVTLRCGARTGERLAMTSPAGIAVAVPADVRSDYIHEVVRDRRWRISGASFFQTRPDGAEALARIVSDSAHQMGTGTCADLYSGVGLFAGVLAAQGWSVSSIEVSRSAVEDAMVNLSGLGVTVLQADVRAWRSSPVDLVVANPGRRGLGGKGVATVLATRASRVILVSCDLCAFVKDTNSLRRNGYSLVSVTPIDLFPHTPHVEVVGVFDRGAADDVSSL